MLQDLSSVSGELPSRYWLSGVRVDRQQCIGRGGEAFVYRGTYKGQKVVVREVTEPRSFWSKPAGDAILKVPRSI